MKRPLFITVEGTDGSGKSTQIEFLLEYLKKEGIDVVLTREPGGTEISEKIRSLILDTKNMNMSDKTEMLLYAASRAQVVAEVIKPSLEKGKTVICDRFIDSSYAYQGYARGMGVENVGKVNEAAIDGIMPDLTLFFDLSPQLALGRLNMSGADRIEKEAMDFHMKVYEGYQELAKNNPDRIKVINSDKSVDEIALEVRKIVGELLKKN